MRKKIYKNVFAATLLINMLCLNVFPSFAQLKPSQPSEAGMTQAQLAGYSEEEWAKLMDNKLEYDEIYDLVKNFNPDIKRAWGTYSKSVENLDRTLDEISAARKDMSDYLDLAKQDGDMELMMLYSAQIKGLDSVKKSMSRSGTNLKKPVSKMNAGIRIATDQVTSAAKNLMISYKSIEEQEKILIEMVRLGESLVKAANLTKAQGMATNVNVAKAMTDYLSAKSNLANIQANKEKIRVSLIKLLGWSETAQPEIGSVPEVDKAYIDSINLEEDTKKANSNNTSLVELRNGRKNASSYENELKDASETAMEGTLKNEMNALYNKIKEDRLAYEASASAFEAAQISFNGANKSKQMGLLSEQDYLMQNFSYVRKKSEYESAKLQLLTDVETYKAAIAGNLSLE